MELSTWTPERTDLLRTLWAQGDTCSAIAREIGGITRNAVVSKAHRIGLPLRGSPSSMKGKPLGRRPKVAFDAAPQPRTRKGNQNNPTRRLAKISGRDPGYVEPTLNANDIPIEQRKQLLALGPRDCRWPYGHVGEPGFFFCAGPKVSGSSYCETHTLLAWRSHVRS